ncbi:MAG TPA: ABC transporter permease [Polyangiaceae bacterium]|nr:ABC transporter permease [Polyangiaceae bacterium]
MTRRLLSRLLWALVTIWAVVTITFFVYNVLPADPAQVIAGPQARPADVARIRRELGLDQPIPVRYVRYMTQLVRFGGAKADAAEDSALWLGPVGIDLGVSYLKRQPVVALLGEALPKTLLLGAFALLVEMIVGVGAGVIAAVRRNTVLDWGVVSLALLGISAPTFVTGLILQYVFAEWLRVLPMDGYGSTGSETLRSVVLPGLTLGLFGAAGTARLVRDEMIGLLKADYIRTARAKGQRGSVIVLRHALRNALLPLVTVLGLSMSGLVGGAIVTEKLFRWPGLGALSVDAIVERDGPVIMGVVLVLSTTVVFANLLVDVSYALLDPRTRNTDEQK